MSMISTRPTSVRWRQAPNRSKSHKTCPTAIAAVWSKTQVATFGKSPFAFLLSLSLFTCAFAQDRWPQFRGSQSLGAADAPNLPDTWSKTENVAWATNIPGVGWSSPIVWGDNIFITSVISSVEGEKAKKGLYFGGERPLAK